MRSGSTTFQTGAAPLRAASEGIASRPARRARETQSPSPCGRSHQQLLRIFPPILKQSDLLKTFKLWHNMRAKPSTSDGISELTSVSHSFQMTSWYVYSTSNMSNGALQGAPWAPLGRFQGPLAQTPQNSTLKFKVEKFEFALNLPPRAPQRRSLQRLIWLVDGISELFVASLFCLKSQRAE